MKNTIIYLAFVFVMVLCIPSCIEDDSTTYQREYSTVKIFAKNKELKATLGETLNTMVDSIVEILPDGDSIKIDPEDPRFEYEWWTGWNSNGKAFIDKINDGYELNLFVDDIYSPYIVFRVHDTENGLEYYANYSFDVSDATGKGFIVVDTKDGVISEFHEIQNQYLYDLNEDEIKVVPNVYKLNQGMPFQGLVSHVAYQEPGWGGLANHSVFVTTEDGNAYSMDGYYNELKTNDAMYMSPRESYKIIGQNKGWAYVTNLTEDGQIEESEFGGNYFLYPLKTGDFSPYQTNVFRPRVYYGMSLFIFDELANRFLRMPFNKGSFIPITSATPLFDYNNVGALDAIYMASGYYPSAGFGKEYGVLSVMKSETAEDYYAYMFKGGEQRIVDLNNCTDINRAVGFTTSTNEKMLYYAVDDKVYAAGLGGSTTPLSYVGFTTPEVGDKITNIEMWLGYDWHECEMQITDINNPEGAPIKVPNTKRMLNITTYNESTGEGKLICVPITVLNSPEHGLERNRDYHRVFDGFGRILATSDMFKSITN